MQLVSILALAGLVLAAPSPARIQAPKTAVNAIILHPDTAHKNVLKSLHPDHIISSDNLYDYFMDNQGANHTIYLHDTRQFIDLSTIKPAKADSKLSGRDLCILPHLRHSLRQVQNWWDTWHPVSACLSNGYSTAVASESISSTFTKSISTNAGIDISIIKDMFGASVGMTVTKSWSHSGSITCNIPGGSVGQIWLQNFLVWGWVWTEKCQSCISGKKCTNYANGGALAPVDGQGAGSVQYGCSTGSDKVQC